jgi:organic hydroperoxide reductase OsmC/OhrA
MMKRFEATLAWQRGDQAFTDLRYNRAHRWHFDGGIDVPASSSPLSVPVPLSDPAAVDPEEALVAAAASCHMLFFLSLAAARGYVVDRYDDRAVGLLDTGPDGRPAITRIILNPAIAFSGEHRPDRAALAELHHEAHARCYIANSLKGEIVVEGFD